MPEELDPTDLEILALLQEDARRPLSSIAREVALSTAAVKRRVDRLRSSGVILGFTAQIDHSKLGWTVQAFIELRFAGTTNISEIEVVTRRMPEAHAVFTIAGDPDALVWLRVSDMAHLQATIDKIRRSRGVTGTRTLIVLEGWSRAPTPVAAPPRRS